MEGIRARAQLAQDHLMDAQILAGMCQQPSEALARMAFHAMHVSISYAQDALQEASNVPGWSESALEWRARVEAITRRP